MVRHKHLDQVCILSLLLAYHTTFHAPFSCPPLTTLSSSPHPLSFTPPPLSPPLPPHTTGRSISRVDRIEQAAIQLVDLLVADISLDPKQLTPLQKLLLEEVGKIVGATARTTFSTAKERSGKLPNGRTVLGTVLDPLGLFRFSALTGTPL